MRIAILAGGLPTLYNGGTEIATAKIATFAVRAGHDVHVIAADGSCKGVETYRSMPFQVHRVPTIPGSYIQGITVIPQATYTLLKLNPELVHVQAMYMAPSAFLTHRKFPYIFFERGGVHMNLLLDRPLYHTFMKHAQRVIAQTENQKRSLLRYYQREVEVIPNGVEFERFGQVSREEARQQLGIPPEVRVVLSVGRCRPEKNLKDFVQAAGLVGNSLFIVVGDGPQLASLKAIAGPNVRFEGSVENTLIPLYMSAANVVANTSSSEGFPVTLLEAMASGLPIVAPRICGIPEIIKSGYNGFLSEPGDYRSTAQQIQLLLDEPLLASAMGSRNKAKVKQYTWENVVEKLYGSA